MKRIYLLLITCFLGINLGYAQTWSQYLNDINGTSGFALGDQVSLSGDGRYVACTSPKYFSERGAVRIFKSSFGNWTQYGSDIINLGTGSLFGSAISLNQSGNTFVVGAYKSLNYRGRTMVYRFDGTNYQQLGPDFIGTLADDRLGSAVDIDASGNTIIIGIPRKDIAGIGTNVGEVKVYDYDGANWIQRGGDIQGSPPNISGYFGSSVSISDDGNTIAAGASSGNFQNGLVRIFNWDGTNWIETGLINGENAGDSFGSSVSLSGDANSLIVGALLNDASGVNAGSASVYAWDGTSWNQRGVNINGEAAGDFFGRSVDINKDGEAIVIGADYNSEAATRAGHMKSYIWDGTAWIQRGTDIDGEGSSYYFGKSVTINDLGSRIASGSPRDNTAGTSSGQSRVFEVCRTPNNTYNLSLCAGDSLVLSNGRTFKENYTGQVWLKTGGGTNLCDSLISLNLNFLDEKVGLNQTTVCYEDSVLINGSYYGASNPTGVEVFTGIGPYGCDSTVTIDLDVIPEKTGTFSATICQGDSLIYNGTTYKTSIVGGNEVFTGIGPNGCDSTVFFNLLVLPAATNTITQVICPGDSIVVNGTAYYNTIIGVTDTIDNGSSNGCDSIITINLFVQPELASTITETICAGESIVVNGTTYNTTVTNATEVFTNIGTYGCDSTVTINLTVLPALTGTNNTTICANEDLIINGITYNAANPSGTEVFYNVGPNGCDSTVTIALNVLSPITGVNNTTICADESILINGTLYNASNLTGTETYTNVGPTGCDSVVTVSINLLPELTGTNNTTLCFGESIDINGTTYSGINQFGTEVFTNVGPNGCDSTVTVAITVLPELTGTNNTTLCFGESIDINGETYDANNLTGIEVFTALNGCDSTVDVAITILSELTGVNNTTLCFGESIDINGETYDANNLTGIEVFTALNGCDSTVDVSITILPELTGINNTTLCDGENIDINGTTYDVNNLTGIEVFTAINGCDSTVDVSITMLAPITGTNNTTLCDGESIDINGTTYDMNNLTGIEVFTAINGCDSTVDVSVTMLAPLTSIDEQYTCDSLVWIDGNSYYSSNNTATYVATSVDGCDSIVTLNLEVSEIDLSVFVSGNDLNSNQSGATYQWLDCTNGYAEIPNETEQSFIGTNDGTYAVQVTLGNCVDTSDCFEINSTGIESFDDIEVSIFPNPTNGVAKFTLDGYTKLLSYSILSLDGRMINQVNNVYSEEVIIDLSNEVKGVYIFSLRLDNAVKTYRIVKQ